MKKILTSILTLIFTLAIAICCSVQISYAQNNINENCHHQTESSSDEAEDNISCDDFITLKDSHEQIQTVDIVLEKHIFLSERSIPLQLAIQIPKNNSPPRGFTSQKSTIVMLV